MNKDCAIARDLMPQVIDDVASDESKTFVQDHMEACEPCTQVYQDMKANLGSQTPDNTDEPVSFMAAMSQLKKALSWKRIRTAIIAVLITAAVFVLGSGIYYFLFVQTEHAQPNDDYQIHLFQSEDNTVYLIPQFFKRLNVSGTRTLFDTDSGIIYTYWRSSVIPGSDGLEPIWYPDYLMRMTMTDDNILIYGEDFIVQEIRQGTEKDYVTVYQAGDILPPLDPAVDEYIRQRDLYIAQMDAACEAMDEAEQMSFDAQSDYHDYIEQWEDGQKTNPIEPTAP